MSDLIKKTVLAGLGFMSFSLEKAEELANTMIKKGEMSKTEGAEFVKDLMDQVEKNKDEIERKIGLIVEKTLEKLNVPTRKELNELKASIDNLGKKGL